MKIITQGKRSTDVEEKQEDIMRHDLLLLSVFLSY
jgi:hypothetical protein